MKLTSKNFAASAATAITFAFLAMSASTAQAADYCITNGAQDAHGCGYPTMEACRAASAGIGGTCSGSGASTTNDPSDAMGYQQKPSRSRVAHHHVKHATVN